MNAKQKELLINCGIGYFPYTLQDALLNHSDYDYSQYNLQDIGSLKNFWKAIKGIEGLSIDGNDTVTIQLKSPDIEHNSIVFIGHNIERIVAKSKDLLTDYKTMTSVYKKMDAAVIEFVPEVPVESLTVVFKDDAAEPLQIKVNLLPYSEGVIDERKMLLNQMKVRYTSGNNSINVRFQLCNEQAVTTRISLYDKNKKFICTYKVAPGDLTQAMVGLAYGRYFFQVEQFDKDDNLIVSSDVYSVQLIEPDGGIFGTFFS